MLPLTDTARHLLTAGYQRVRDLLVPVVTPTPQPRPRARHRRSYDGAAGGYRTDGWLSSSSDANAEVQGGLVKLRERSRDLVRNEPHAARAIRSLTTNLVGAGIRPLPATGSESLDKRISELWEEWAKHCYPSNRSTIYTLQSLLARAWFESGEAIVRLRPRRVADMPNVPPLQIQVLEGDHLPIDDVIAPRNGNRVEQGVEFDGLDRRVAYHLHRSHPGSTSLTRATTEMVRVPASSVVHLYQELRPGQIRGVPWLAPVMLALWDLGGYADAERVRAKSAALVAAFVEGGETPDGEDDLPEGIAGPHTDDNGGWMVDSDGYPIDGLKPGMVAYLPAGKQVTLNNPGTPGGYDAYLKAHLREIAAGVGLSYEVFTGDLSGTNYSSIKLGQNEQNKMIEALREQVFLPFAMEPIYEAFLDAAIAAGLLPSQRKVYKHTWSRPLVASIDRTKDAAAAQAEIRAGLRSRREVIASDYGRDPDQVDADIAADNAAKDKLGLVLDSDPRWTGKSGSAPPGSAPPGADSSESSEETDDN